MSFIGNAIGKLVGGITGANQAADAAKEAAGTQAASAQLGIDEQRREFDLAQAEQRRQLDAFQQLLAPYVNAGSGALTAQQDLVGLNGNGAQQEAIAKLQESPQYQALTRSGQDAILANASATGGLRGGNVQSALAQFQPTLLAQLIEQQYGRLGGLTALGQNSAVGEGTAGINTGSAIAQGGMQTGANVANLLQQQGAATAGGQIAAGGTVRQAFGDLLKIGSLAAGAYGLGGAGAAGANGAGYAAMNRAGQF
jgi:hypothetical protein